MNRYSCFEARVSFPEDIPRLRCSGREYDDMTVPAALGRRFLCLGVGVVAERREVQARQREPGSWGRADLSETAEADVGDCLLV
jgi:hypothetical protein